MPRDHFRPPLDLRRSWEGLHGAWPNVMVKALNQRLSEDYAAAPRVHLGATGGSDVVFSGHGSLGAAAGDANPGDGFPGADNL